ncbi:MAG: anthranilate phosphoribosyltransferase [Clostridia bacterium]|nr:anthranilate phosphoribosyltransferase [Clostridia bacterium]
MTVETIEKVTRGEDLTILEAENVAREIMCGKAEEEETARFLSALAQKGESTDEICAFARIMRENSVRTAIGPDCLDIVGTGGDKSGTFNISTCAAFVAAACGVKVAKHGNVSVSSKCGAADILERLGVDVRADPAENAKAFSDCGVAFLHAQVYHPAMRYVAPVRAKLGTRTIFNILGPLANPARAEYEVLGVFSPEYVRPLCEALKNLGCKRVVSVHGGGTDEVSVFSSTVCCEADEDGIREYKLEPEDFGVERREMCDILGGDAERNAEIFMSVLDGRESAYLDAVAVNAAMCLYVYGLEGDLKKACARAKEATRSGAAKRVFERYREELKR